MANLYLDPNGRKISFREWKNRVPAEYVIHEHKTPKSITKLVAADLIVDANIIPAERHKRYRMESVNILTQDAYGQPYDEPKVVEDEFAKKAFPTKDKATKAYIDFLCEWCGGEREALEAALAKEVAVTPVPAVEIAARDMELKSLSAKVAPGHVDGEEESDDDDDSARGKGATEKSAPAYTPPPAPVGSDKPVTSIDDDIGAW